MTMKPQISQPDDDSDEDELVNPPPDEGIYKCINGHIIEGVPYSMITVTRGREVARFEVCPICYIQWVRAHVPSMTKLTD